MIAPRQHATQRAGVELSSPRSQASSSLTGTDAVEDSVTSPTGGRARGYSVGDAEMKDLMAAFSMFDANNSKCFVESDRQRLLGVIETGFGSAREFDRLIRTTFVAQLKQANCSVAQLRACGIGADKLQAAGVGLGSLIKAGFSCATLKPLFTLKELRRPSVGSHPHSHSKSTKSNGSKERSGSFSAEGEGFDLDELLAAKFELRELKKANFSAAELRAHGFGAVRLSALLMATDGEFN